MVWFSCYYNYIANWFFLPIHLFVLPSMLFLKVRIPYYYRLSTFVEYPIAFSNNFKLWFRFFNPLYEYNCKLLNNKNKIIDLIILLFNNLQLKIIKLIILWQYKGVPVINLFWLSVGLIIKLVFNFRVFYYLFNFLIRLYAVVFVFVNLFLFILINYSYIAYNKSNNLFDLLYAIIYFVYCSFIGSIIGLIRWIFLLPLIILGRYKYWIIFIFVCYFFLNDFNCVLSFIMWMCSVYPIGNVVTFIREQNYEFYIAWTLIDNSSFIDNSLAVYNNQLLHYFYAKKQFKLIGNVWIDFSQTNEWVINLPFFFNYFGFDESIIIKYHKFKPLIIEGYIVPIILKYYVLVAWYKYLLNLFFYLYLNKTVFIFYASLATSMKIYCMFKYLKCLTFYLLFLLFLYIQTIWLYFVPFVVNDFFNFKNIYFIFYDEIFYGKFMFHSIIRGYIFYNKILIKYIFNILLNNVLYFYDYVVNIIILLKSKIYNNIIYRENLINHTNYTKLWIYNCDFDIKEYSHYYINYLFSYEEDPNFNFRYYYLYYQHHMVSSIVYFWGYLVDLFFVTNSLYFVFLLFCHDIYNELKVFSCDIPIFCYIQYIFSALILYFLDSLNDLLRLNIFNNMGNVEIFNIANVELYYLQRSPRWLFSIYRSPKQNISFYIESLLLSNFCVNLDYFFNYDDTYTWVYKWERIIRDDIGIIDEDGIYNYNLFYYEYYGRVFTSLLYRSFVDNNIGILLIIPRFFFLIVVYYLYNSIGKPEYYYNICICEKLLERNCFFYVA